MAKRVVANITSDILCPWCWVGKRSLENAVQSLRADGASVEVALRWHPYFLHKGVPEEGVDKLSHYAASFGKKRAKEFLNDDTQLVRVRGRELGIQMQWTKGTILSNAMKGHKLLWAVLEVHGAEVQNQLMEVLFRKYFTENLDIGDVGVLTAAMHEVGLSTDGLEEIFESERLRQLVEEKHAFNKENIKTIPHFELSNEGEAQDQTQEPLLASGSCSEDQFKQLITKLL